MSDMQFVHLHDVVTRGGFLTQWERRRHTKQVHWFIECFAEALGVFIYCYAGIGSTAGYVIGTLSEQPGVSSILQIGFAYMAGIVLALAIVAGTSGGHINPVITLTFACTGQFPWRKVPRYIIAQIFGGFVASLLVYVQWKTLIVEIEAALQAKGVYDAINYTPNGPAGIIALYAPAGSSLGRVFINEFVTDFFLGLAIFAALDPTNWFCPPVAAPFIIGLAYAVAIWGYAANGLSANAARDLGGRFAALCIWGRAASGGSYAAIAALTNIPATMLARAVYEIMFTDSSRVITSGAREHLEGTKAHLDRRANGHPAPGNMRSPHSPHDSRSTTEKAEFEHIA